MRYNFNPISLLAGMALVLPACNGIFSDIYDTPDISADADYGFVEICTPTKPGRIFVDATSYTDWVYLSFDGHKVISQPVTEDAPASWDLALHRYDAKTNGGSVAISEAKTLEEAATAPCGDFTKDIWTTTTIVTDMSTMMDGYLSYEPSFYNAILSEWLDVDTNTMPPIYTLSGKIYILRLSDGSRAALRLVDFMNTASIKGFLTIEYIYPL